MYALVSNADIRYVLCYAHDTPPRQQYLYECNTV